MENDKLLNRLIGQLCDAGLEAVSWDSALDPVMRAVGAETQTRGQGQLIAILARGLSALRRHKKE